MKKYILIIIIAFFAYSCNKQYNDAMKSADKEVILKIANDMYAKKKWGEALALFERVQNLVSGTEEASDVLFKSAYANYYDKQYRLAGHQFKKFSANASPNDSRKEEAVYMAAICYYQGSMDYNLDQSSTELAINELQNFLNNYPNSQKAVNINKLIDELSHKLEYKAYENALQYYKMLEYKAAIISFENVLNDFPSTKLRPKIENYLLKSKTKIAIDSKFDLKRERLEGAIAYTYHIEKDHPDSHIAKEACKLREDLQRELEQFEKLEVQVEKRREELEAKQKIQDEDSATEK